MRLSGVRRAALAAGLATAAALTLSACSAGQVAETALKKPSNGGVNASTADGSVVIRNLQVVYNGTEGYAAGANAPIQMAIYNQTRQQIVVTVTSTPPATPNEQIVSARQVGLIGVGGAAAATPSESAAPEPSGSRPPATPDTDTPENIPTPDASDSAAPPPSASPAGGQVQPARITIEPMGYVSFLPGEEPMLTLVGLSGRLVTGVSANLVFGFSHGALPLTLPAPMAVPLSPAPRGSAVPGENQEPENEEGTQRGEG
jgi:hypothetical protein